MHSQKPKNPRKASTKKYKKILKLKKLYQMLSPSKVRRKKNNQMLQKKLEYFFKKEIKPKKPYQTCNPTWSL